MGAVYQARDQRLGTTVALKETFFSESDPTMRKVFEREARLLASLRHPALPVVHDHFVEGNGQYLVMEFIPGDNLFDKLQAQREAHRQPFPVDQVLAWADELLDALEYLHEHQVIHRDIKPQNLKVTPRDKLFLLDFGLAKGMTVETVSAGVPSSVPYYTQYYAPLEQELAVGTDARSDLYSAAATLYHLLTGVLPPDALRQRAEAQRQRQPDPLRPADQANPVVPRDVAKALEWAMALDRENRPATAAELRQALGLSAGQRTPSPGPAPAPAPGPVQRKSPEPSPGPTPRPSPNPPPRPAPKQGGTSPSDFWPWVVTGLPALLAIINMDWLIRMLGLPGQIGGFPTNAIGVIVVLLAGVGAYYALKS
jgi:serine/threonine protein kinase